MIEMIMKIMIVTMIIVTILVAIMGPQVHKLPRQPNPELGLHGPTSTGPRVHGSTSYPHNQIRSSVCTNQPTLVHRSTGSQATRTTKSKVGFAPTCP